MDIQYKPFTNVGIWDLVAKEIDGYGYGLITKETVAFKVSDGWIAIPVSALIEVQTAMNKIVDIVNSQDVKNYDGLFIPDMTMIKDDKLK